MSESVNQQIIDAPTPVPSPSTSQGDTDRVIPAHRHQSDMLREALLCQAPKKKTTAAGKTETVLVNLRANLFPKKAPVRYEIGDNKKVQLTVYRNERRVTIRHYKDEESSTSSKAISLTAGQ